jgi:iron complex transport system ATP-binding protein
LYDYGRSRRMREPVLELVNATVVKGGVTILHALTLTIQDGEHTAILGPNGAGKSTLVKLLTHHEYAWAMDPADGAQLPPVRVYGDDRWDVQTLRAQLGVVSADMHQRFVAGNSAGNINAEDVVISGLYATHGFLHPEQRTEDARRAAAASLARVDAGHLAGKMMDEMSTGEARRVLIARALVTNPRALILDEPTSGLDVVSRHRFLNTVERVGQAGTTLIFVTHHVEEIVPSVARVVLLKDGRVAHDGPKAEMLTDARLTDVFGAPVFVTERDGRYYARA